jgi:hypothetical protein
MTVSSPECSCFLQFARACIFSLETMEHTILPISIFRRSLWFSNELIVSFITGTQMAPWKLSQACVKSTELLISCQAGNAHAEMRSLSAGDISSWHNECNQVLHQNAWQYVHVPKDSSLLKFKNITGILKAQFKIHHYGMSKAQIGFNKFPCITSFRCISCQMSTGSHNHQNHSRHCTTNNSRFKFEFQRPELWIVDSLKFIS